MLYIVATPIGNLSDITVRALETLGSVDLILCEDTRVSRKLLAHFNIAKPVLSYHQHSTPAQIDKIISLLAAGKNLAVITDAGTPGIADPGGLLVASVLEKYITCHCEGAKRPWQSQNRPDQHTNPEPQIKIIPIPGPSALAAALSICGFNTQQFVFLGWPPHKKGREKYFKQLAAEPRVIIFYESVYRIKNCLERLASLCPNRQMMLARELTKKFETIYRGPAADVLASLTPEQVKGEFVVVLSKK